MGGSTTDGVFMSTAVYSLLYKVQNSFDVLLFRSTGDLELLGENTVKKWWREGSVLFLSNGTWFPDDSDDLRDESGEDRAAQLNRRLTALEDGESGRLGVFLKSTFLGVAAERDLSWKCF